MIRRTLITLACLASAHAVEAPGDLLRFTNGDQLHGHFVGIGSGPSVLWQREDLKTPIQLDIKNLRHVVLHNGNPTDALNALSLVELVNGDQIPGLIKSMDQDTITLETSYAGKLILPRNKVTRLAPHPLGGKIHYHGPFSPDGWDIVGLNFDSSINALNAQIRINGVQQGIVQLNNDAGDDDDDEGKEPAEVWKHAGASWYWQGNRIGSTLIRKNCLPDSSILRFDLAWKGHLNVVIGINADFCNLEKLREKDDDKDNPQRFTTNNSENYPKIFGNSYVLQMQSNYFVIYRSIVDDKGETSVQRIQAPSSRLRLGENSSARIEIRSDTASGNFSFFVDDEFVTQWNDQDLQLKNAPGLKGRGFGLLPQLTNGAMKVTDVMISEWNGMPDSARSMQVDDQDIILMTNGLDRLSGSAITLSEDGLLSFKGKHGTFQLPIDEIAEIRFARNQLVKPEPATEQMLKVRFSPFGCITGIPVSGDRSAMLLRSQAAGNITLNTAAAVMLEFDATQQIFDDWNESF